MNSSVLIAICPCQDSEKPQLHTGRVFEFGRDYRSDEVVGVRAYPPGTPVLKVQVTYNQRQLHELGLVLDPPVQSREFVIACWEWYYIAKEQVMSRIGDLKMDYRFGEDPEKLGPDLDRPLESSSRPFIRRMITTITVATNSSILE